MKYLLKIKTLFCSLSCKLGLHYREWYGHARFQPHGTCIWCRQEVVAGSADLRQGVTAYPIPPDCKKLLSTSIQGYQDTYTVNEHEGELLVSPSPARTHVRGLKITYIRKPTEEEEPKAYG